MSEYIFDVVNQTSKLDWAFAFQRTGAFPLDRSSLFSSYSDAEAYARGDKSDARELGGASYVGQPVSIYDVETNTVSLYIIEADRSLKAVGSAPLGDDATIEIVDGKVQLKDFGLSYYAYTPAEKDENNEITKPAGYVLTEGFKAGLEPRVQFENEKYSIAWYEPSGSTIEDIAASIDSVREDVSSLSNSIDEIREEIGQPAEEEIAATGLYAKLEEKADKSTVYTKTEADAAIARAVSNVDHLKRSIVPGIEAIDAFAEDAEQYIYMVPNAEGKYDEYMVISHELEKVGDWSVNLDDYARVSDLETKVDKVEGSRLISEEEVNKLANIPETAEENYIKSTSNEFSVEEGNLSLVKIAQAKVDGLIDTLDTIASNLEKKVDSEEGSRLISADEIDKLASIKDLLQSVDTDKFTIDEDGKLLLNSVEISEIEGLANSLAQKVDKVAGSRLITEQEANKLEKLSIDEDGNVGLSGTVSAGNVQELYNAVVNIVTGSGTGLYDDIQRPLLAIEVGAERNVVQSVNTNELSINENRQLSVKEIGMNKVTGLITALTEKATVSQVTSVSDLLNQKVADYDNRIASLEGRLTWQRLTD